MSADFEPPESEDYTFSQWLDSTTELQIKAYGCDPIELLDNSKVSWLNPSERETANNELADFIRWNVLALQNEINEFLDECPIWKPWSTSTVVNNELAAIELVDALHFIANLLRLIGVDGVTLTALYKDKQLKNAQRMRDGYDGVKEKCPGCKRDKTEIGSHSEQFMRSDTSLHDVQVCNGCGVAW